VQEVWILDNVGGELEGNRDNRYATWSAPQFPSAVGPGSTRAFIHKLQKPAVWDKGLTAAQNP
jgi:hypothetical protein